MFLMAVSGYTSRTNFLVGTSLAQISEFSFILLALGVSVSHVSQDVLSTLTLAGIITIAISTYMTIYSQEFYEKMRGFASIFEKKGVKREINVKNGYDAILFGYNRIGFSILRSLKTIKKKYLVVDFNPDVINDLQKFKIPAIYGDAYDADLLQELPLNKVGIVVSTLPDPETNVLLIETMKATNPKAIVIVRAHSIEQALEFYKKGATYVLTPHFLGGEYLAGMIKDTKFNEKGYADEREKHIAMLMERLQAGQRHPEVEKN